MPLQATSGAASYDGFGGGVPVAANYIEDVFSTYLYIGNGSTQTITNGIDLAGKGGMIWIKNRDSTVTQYTHNMLVDTVRGINTRIMSNLTNGQFTNGPVSAFNTNGFSLDTINSSIGNESGGVYASWTFRKQPKFFDVVTYTGDGSSTYRTISHSLGSTPGFILVKSLSTGNWIAFHRSLSNTSVLFLNQTDAANSLTGGQTWSADSTTVTLPGLNFSASPSGNTVNTNANGVSYVMYVFAHDAGGFGLTGTDNVISCGSVVSTGGNIDISLGYEPQWILMKNASNIDSWYLYDTMRGMSLTDDAYLRPNNSTAEGTFGASYINPTATGFRWNSGAFGAAGETYIYIAIRRGPMKTPTTGTSVYNAIARTGTSATATVTGVGFPPDLAVIKDRVAGSSANWLDRLRGPNRSLRSTSSGAEFTSASDVLTSYDQNGVTLGSDAIWSLGTNTSGNAMINWFFRRAPGFFDEVCYTGDGTFLQTVNHNLGVVPELIIQKRRLGTGSGSNWYAATVASGSIDKTFFLNSGDANGQPQAVASPTATTITAYNDLAGNVVNAPYVAYLFASCPGVSKVGSYTGNGSSQTISCGFTGGARWVMIKRADSSGDWYVWDSTRGIVAGNDPRIRIGVGAAEDTTDDSLDTNSTGFIVNQDAATNINVSSASYIFLAIA